MTEEYVMDKVECNPCLTMGVEWRTARSKPVAEMALSISFTTQNQEILVEEHENGVREYLTGKWNVLLVGTLYKVRSVRRNPQAERDVFCLTHTKDMAGIL